MVVILDHQVCRFTQAGVHVNSKRRAPDIPCGQSFIDTIFHIGQKVLPADNAFRFAPGIHNEY
jgi:hypothetical protein